MGISKDRLILGLLIILAGVILACQRIFLPKDIHLKEFILPGLVFVIGLWALFVNKAYIWGTAITLGGIVFILNVMEKQHILFSQGSNIIQGYYYIIIAGLALTATAFQKKNGGDAE